VIRKLLFALLGLAGCGGDIGSVDDIVPRLLERGEACEAGSQCASGVCVGPLGDRVCGKSCTESLTCDAGESCLPDLIQASGGDQFLPTCRSAATTGELYGSRCGVNEDCITGLCIDGLCSQLCGACPSKSKCESSAFRWADTSLSQPVCLVRLAEPALVFGPVDTPLAGSTARAFEIPPNTASFVLTLVDNDGLRVGIRKLTAPDGTTLIDIDDQAADVNPGGQYIGVASTQVPSSDNPLASVQAGTWTVVVGTFDPANFLDLDPVAGAIEEVRVVIEPVEEIGGTLDLNIHLSPGLGFSAETATQSAFLADVLQQVQDRLATPTGFNLGDVRYFDTSDEHETVENGEETRGICAALTNVGPRGASVSVFVVRDLVYTSGQAGGTPGPPSLCRTNASCIVMEKLGNGTQTGLLMAHEIGHYLGLRHTSELTGGYDAISDTSQCPTGTNVSDCPDYRNLMFPAFPLSTNLGLTAGQILVTQRNPFLYE
jgi:hypothetical protein